MRKIIPQLVILFMMSLTGLHARAAETYVPGKSFLSLCYHNVEDEHPDQTFVGVTTSKFIEQLGWLKSEGYQAVSIDDLLAARDGRKPLPPKAVFLTIDDGYEGVYTRIYPALRAFHFPAVIGIVDQWMQGGPGDKVRYGTTFLPRSEFLTWPQVREMAKSGLVEVVSHTDALHYGLLANPQGNTQPAVTTAAYNPKTGAYETPEAYRNRLEADAEKSAQTIARETGKRPRAIIWPYGSYNQLSVMVYRRHGMPISMSLDDGFASVDRLDNISRYLVNKDPGIDDFAFDIRTIDKPEPMRVVQVDLDYVYDSDPKQLERNLDALIARI
jgi:biofilm PGA synthesis lipoprotein PgaB